MTTFLIVPCFNEQERLQREEFLRLLARRPELTLLFVDDGSTDGTAAVLESIRARATERVVVHRLSRNSGKAEAVRQGLCLALRSGAEVVGYADADLSTPVEELEQMLSRMENRAPAALLGSRVRLLGRAIQRRAHRHYLGRIFATIASLALGISVYDTQCGAKLFRRTEVLVAALAAPFESRWIFDVELLHRLLTGVGAAAPLALQDLEEWPLRTWRDVEGSKLRAGAMFRAGVQLMGLVARTFMPGARPAAALTLAAVIGLTVPAKVVRHWWLLKAGGASPDPGSRFVSRAEALAASVPLEPVEFLSDSRDPGDRGRRFCLVQHALAPRMLEDHGVDTPVPAPMGRRCGFALASLQDPSKGHEFASERGMRILADGGEGLLLLRACQ